MIRERNIPIILATGLIAAVSLDSHAEVPAFQIGPNSTVGTTYPGRIVLNDLNDPNNTPAVPCPDQDALGNATAYTCRDIVRDTTVGASVLVREVISPDNEVFYQTLVSEDNNSAAVDDNGILGNTARLESFVRSSQGGGGLNQGSGIKAVETMSSPVWDGNFTLPTTPTMTGSPQVQSIRRASVIFTGFADTRLDAPALQDIDQQVLATSFEDPFELVSVRINASSNIALGGPGSADFDFAGIHDSDGNPISSEISIVSEQDINFLDGRVGVFTPGSGVEWFPSKWRATISDKQRFSFRSRSVYDSSGNQTVTGSRTEITQEVTFMASGSSLEDKMSSINVNPNFSPSPTNPWWTADSNTQAVWDGYDKNYFQSISLMGDMIAAPSDGGLGDGNAGITLGGETLTWPAGTAGNPQQRLTSTLVAQRLAFRRHAGDVQNNTSQTVIYDDGMGGKTQISQTSGARPQDMGDDNNGGVWDWDLTFAPVGASAPEAPGMSPFDPFDTGGIVDPFLNPTIPSCLPTDPANFYGAC